MPQGVQGLLCVLAAGRHRRDHGRRVRSRALSEAVAKKLRQAILPVGYKFRARRCSSDAILQSRQGGVDLSTFPLPLRVVLGAVHAMLRASQVYESQAALLICLAFAADEDAANKVGPGGLIVHSGGGCGSQFDSHLHQRQQLGGVRHSNLNARMRVNGAICPGRQAARPSAVEHVDAGIAQQLYEGDGDFSAADRSEELASSPLVERRHRVRLPAAGLPVHHDRPPSTSSHGAHGLARGVNVDRIIVCSLVKHSVEGEVVVV
mmetsp:Transcript_16291/g.35672  ORF Transcript_16291/g.35672 Transcript_16291/m.35672 type:complete len:263 (+) Transcript_16291:1589-2377(+)